MFPEALSVLMLCAPVFIFTSGSSALLGHPCCGLLIWLSLLAIFNTLIFFMRKWSKHENTRGPHTKIAADGYPGTQSINTESFFKCCSLHLFPIPTFMTFTYLYNLVSLEGNKNDMANLWNFLRETFHSKIGNAKISNSPSCIVLLDIWALIASKLLNY